jgi:peptidyl-prolyl isomerase G (cyclophilin G)
VLQNSYFCCSVAVRLFHLSWPSLIISCHVLCYSTTQPAPHLDNVHVVFGRVVGGVDVVRQIESLPVDANSRPLQDAKIVKCGELVRQVKVKKDKKKKKEENENEEESSGDEKKKKKHKKDKKKEKKDKRHKEYVELKLR